MPRVKMPQNPFFHLLALLGVVFCLSAWLSYLVSLRTATRAASPHAAARGGRLVEFVQDHAGVVLAVELLLLAACAVAAVVTDRFRSARLVAGTRDRQQRTERRPPD